LFSGLQGRARAPSGATLRRRLVAAAHTREDERVIFGGRPVFHTADFEDGPATAVNALFTFAALTGVDVVAKKLFPADDQTFGLGLSGRDWGLREFRT
jgi:hypothetical protein